MLNLNIYV